MTTTFRNITTREEAHAKLVQLLEDDRYKHLVMETLLEKYVQYTGQMFIPAIVKKRSEDYFSEKDEILKWFRLYYDPCEITEDPDTYLTIDEVFSYLTEFDFYKNLKRKLTKQSLINKFKEHDWFKSGYEEKFEKIYLGKTYNKNHIIKGWKKIIGTAFITTPD